MTERNTISVSPTTDASAANLSSRPPRVSRRQFLHASAAAIITTTHALQAPKRSDAAETKGVSVGAHPWVYAATQPNYDITPILDRIFADMKYAGMDGIELMHTALRPDDSVQRIGGLSDEHALPVLGTSFGGAMWNREVHTEILEDVQLVIERVAQVGGKTLGTSVGSAGRKKTTAELDAQAEVLREIMAICASNDVQLNLHNHKYEVEDNLYDLRHTIQRIPEIKLGPDLDWLVQADVDPVQFLSEFGERIVFLHLRDQQADKTWVEAMGEGDMDYGAVRKVLTEMQFGGYAIIELAHPRGMELKRPLRESLKISREFVRATLGY